MVTSQHIQTLSSASAEGAWIANSDTHRLMALGRERGWGCAVLGRAPLPDTPVRLGPWLIVPVHQDPSLIPDRALERVQAIFAAGLRPQGFVLVHEAPRLLTAPAHAAPHPWWLPALPPALRPALRAMALGLGAVAVALIALVGVAFAAAALISAALLLALPALAVGAVAVDPILVAVTGEGDWVEIDRWSN